MYSMTYVGWDDGTSLYHYGIKGQHWGERRYQNPDGSLTPEGRARYLSGASFGSKGYVSSASRKALERGGKNSAEYKANREYDKKIEKYVNNTETGKNLLKNILAGPAGAMTYNMARAAGESRGKALVRTMFDINLSSFAGGLANTGVTSLLGGKDKVTVDLENMDLSYKKGNKAGAVAGYAAGYGTQVALRNSGRELSLQQRALRNKYAKTRK